MKNQFVIMLCMNLGQKQTGKKATHKTVIISYSTQEEIN